MQSSVLFQCFAAGFVSRRVHVVHSFVSRQAGFCRRCFSLFSHVFYTILAGNEYEAPKKYFCARLQGREGLEKDFGFSTFVRWTSCNHFSQASWRVFALENACQRQILQGEQVETGLRGASRKGIEERKGWPNSCKSPVEWWGV